MQGKQRSSEAKEEELLVVSNSTVIIALARICRLDLLKKLFRKILVPEAVWREITVEGKSGSEKIVRAEFIYVEKASNERLVAFLGEFVDRGEAEAIVLALELNADLLLVDEHGVRKAQLKS